MTPLQHAELISITMKLAEDDTLAPAVGASAGQLVGLSTALQSLSSRPLGIESVKDTPAAVKPLIDKMRAGMLKKFPMGSSARMAEVVRSMGPKGVARLLLTYGLLGTGAGALGGYGLQKGYQALRGDS